MDNYSAAVDGFSSWRASNSSLWLACDCNTSPDIARTPLTPMIARPKLDSMRTNKPKEDTVKPTKDIRAADAVRISPITISSFFERLSIYLTTIGGVMSIG